MTTPRVRMTLEKSKGGVYARRAQFALNARHWKHTPAKR
jgi:hypothetical protein